MSILGDYIEFVVDNRGKTPPSSNIDEYELIETTSIVGSNKYVDFHKISKFVDVTTYQNWFRKGHPRKGDLLISTVGLNIGNVSIINEERGCIAQNLVGLRPNQEKLNPDFLYYFLTQKFVQDKLKNLNIGSAQPSLKVPHLLNLRCEFPDIVTQTKTASILSALDDRISLLRETNATLEAIAQALFKSWFVDFEPIHAKQQGREPEGMDEATAALFPDSFDESELGLVPKGWSISTIGETCDFQNGYAFKSNEMTKSQENTYKVFKMGNIRKGGGLNRSGTKDYFAKVKSGNLGRYLLKKGDLLMCMTDMKDNVALLGHTALMDVDNEFLLNQRVGMIRTKDISVVNYPYLYILTNSDFFLEDLRRRANSGVQVNLSTSEIKSTKFILPPKEIHQRFNEVVEAIQEKIFIAEQQQDFLSALRDSLLPRLISGQLRLPEAETRLEEACA